jgi:type IV secretory pathway TraG/TraD family ATPase VirD4
MIYLGRDVASRIPLWGSPENSYLLLAPPRRGKGLGVVIPNLVTWEGPAVIPSTKDDNVVHTACLHRDRPVYVFDPLCISEWPSRMRWSPVARCSDPEVAIYRAKALTVASGVTGGIDHADYWQAYNETIYRCYLHAAALAGRDLTAIRAWVNRGEIAEPARILAGSSSAPEWSDDLRAIGAMDARGQSAVFSGARRVLDCLADPRVLDACRPTEGEAFDVDRFLSDRGILYAICPTGSQANLAPIITALIETIVDVAKRRAAREPNRRLTPPLGLFLDECANVSPLPSLPQLVSDGGGQGIMTMVVLQSFGQARARWGADASAALWDACTAKIVLGGLADARDLEAISKLCGEIDQVVYSETRGDDGASSRSTQRRRVPVLTPADIRNLPKWRGLLLYEELRPIITTLPGWWAMPQHRARVEASIAAYDRRRARPSQAA